MAGKRLIALDPFSIRCKQTFIFIIDVSSVTQQRPVTIRDIELIWEMREVEALQKEVWGCDDRDIVPLTILAATREIGAILVGAFDGSSLIGFAYSFIGREDERMVHHSHMLAVKPSYRNVNLGYKLKLAQRDRALGQGITRMTWTFDPLQSLNAYFNFAKLGVVANAYKINFYGEATSSYLHQIGTDRLWVTWPLDSRRVHERLQIKSRVEPQTFTSTASYASSKLAQTTCLRGVSHQKSPVRKMSRSRSQRILMLCSGRALNWRYGGAKQRGGPSSRPYRLDIKSKTSTVHRRTVRRLVSICSATADKSKTTSKDPLALNY